MEKYTIEKGLFYNVFYIGKRKVFSPQKELKEFQKKILSIIKEKYKIKLNLKSTAEIHCNQKWILKMDIKDFYWSVPSNEIKKVIQEIFGKFDFQNRYSTKIIYKYCTVGDRLPVGAITSAHLANICFFDIDEKIYFFCKKNKINYSRYMDDLFFSCSDKKKLNKVEKFVRQTLEEHSYKINEEKVHYISDNKRQEILGVVVNNREVKISNLNKREYRSLFFNYLKSIFLEERLGVAHLFHKKINFDIVNGHLSYVKTTDYAFYKSMISYIKRNIVKFSIQKNEEVKKLMKILKITKVV